MSDKSVGWIACIVAIVFIFGAIGGCWHRAEAIQAHLMEVEQ